MTFFEIAIITFGCGLGGCYMGMLLQTHLSLTRLMELVVDDNMTDSAAVSKIVGVISPAWKRKFDEISGCN